MNIIDKHQNTNILVVIGAVTILTGFVGILAYLENKKHIKMKDEVLNLEKEIKTLELAHKTQKAKSDGILV